MAVQFFGQFLLEKGIIDADQLLKVIAYQEVQNLRIGEFAIRQGLLSESDAVRVNQLQLSEDIRFGEAAIQLGLLDDVDVEILLAAQRNSHIYFGEAVVLLRLAKKLDIEAALAEFDREQKEFQRENIVIEASGPIAELAEVYFDLALKLLLRYWGVEAKAGEIQTDLTQLTFAGNGVRVDIGGDIEARCFLSAPDGAADLGGKKILKVMQLKPAERRDLTRELLNLICGNMTARLSQQGKNITILPPENVASPVALGRAIAVRLAGATTHGPFAIAVSD